jgi:CheY-like chemotaxis protein
MQRRIYYMQQICGFVAVPGEANAIYRRIKMPCLSGNGRCQEKSSDIVNLAVRPREVAEEPIGMRIAETCIMVSVDYPAHRRNPQPIAILLVEDNLTTLGAYAKLLRGDGYTVHVADGYQSALLIAKSETLDLAICDINLWDGDGCDLLGELQLLQPVKGIAITGYTLPEETEHYRDAGFSVVLRKPVHHSEIASAISQLSATLPITIATPPGRNT